jgi:hypothetical protein
MDESLADVFQPGGIPLQKRRDLALHALVAEVLRISCFFMRVSQE